MELIGYAMMAIGLGFLAVALTLVVEEERARRRRAKIIAKLFGDVPH